MDEDESIIVIEGTLEDEKVIPALTEELRKTDENECQRLTDEYADVYEALATGAELEGELLVRTSDLADALQLTLDNLAPEGMYFGTTDDGADFGWHPLEMREEELAEF